MSDCGDSDQSSEQPMDQPEPADQKDSGEGLCTGDEFKLETAPFDSRFPNQNQTKYCYVSFLDYHRCIKTRGEDYEPCQYFQRVFKSICPNAWVEKWTEQIEAGTFAGKIDC